MKIFEKNQTTKEKSSGFDLSHERKMSINMGLLYPSYIEEVIPGDYFKVNSEVLLRFAPMIAPIMHRVDAYVHFFFVPNRLMFDDWEDFITGGPDGESVTAGVPKLLIAEARKGYFAKGRLPDYLGIPPIDSGVTVNGTFYVNAFPTLAYNLIYNEYYRDQNLIDPVDVPLSGGSLGSTETAFLTTIKRRAWEKDYFTSALPFTQRGETVGVPVDFDYSDISKFISFDTDSPFTTEGSVSTHGSGTGGTGETFFGTNVSNGYGRIENLDDTALQMDIIELRRAARLQEWLEKNARGGARYIETILNHFGVRGSDYRLQRPEYLGGGKTPVVISEVLNTSDTTNAPQGNMSGHGLSVGKTNQFSRRFEEHGYIMGIMSVIPKTGYQQGIPKHMMKFDKLDYYWPAFANLGEQEIKNYELFVDYSEGLNETTFGYTMRYAEYKYRSNEVAGEFRDSLDHWHLSRKFDNDPALNQDFVECNPSDRIWPVQVEEDPIYVQLYNKVHAARLMPYFSNPKL
jgi:hypothetical protein